MVGRKIQKYICSVTKSEPQNQSQQFLCQLQQSLIKTLKLTFCRALRLLHCKTWNRSRGQKLCNNSLLLFGKVSPISEVSTVKLVHLFVISLCFNSTKNLPYLNEQQLVTFSFFVMKLFSFYVAWQSNSTEFLG